MTTTQATAAPKTIARNATRKIAVLKAQLKTCHSYSLAGNFIAERIDPAWGWLQFEAGRGRLTDNGDGTATLHFHSNHWLKFSAAEHFHAVSDPANWSCEYAHPYATEADAALYAECLETNEGLTVTVVPCRKSA